MSAKGKRQDTRLSSARAYYRLAAKCDRAGQHVQADHYRQVADRLVAEARREREARENKRRAEAAWRAEQAKKAKAQ